MKVKLKKISTKSFIMIFAVINVAAGFILGAVVSVVSLVAPPDEQSAGSVGAWAILVFPVVNGLLGLVTGAFLTGLYNVLAQVFGGIYLEFDNVE